MEPILFYFLPVFFVTLSTMIVFWFWGKIRNNYAVIDVGWGLVILFILFTYYFVKNHFELEWGSLVFVLLVTLWGLRLSIFLFLTRILPGHAEDKRYNSFRKDYGEKVHSKFFTNVFLFQGLLALILTAPFLVVFLSPSSNYPILGIAGILLFFIGEIGETVADQQLSSFIKNPKNKGEVCKLGLWKFSRHPNYFFEWMIWLGLSIYAAQYHWLGILPAIFMYILLVHVTGVPFAEKFSLLSKGDKFREYQRTTNSFFPWFPRK